MDVEQGQASAIFPSVEVPYRSEGEGGERLRANLRANALRPLRLRLR